MDQLTALHFAAQNGHTEACRLLITAGLPVNTKTRKHVTALHFACQKGTLATPLLWTLEQNMTWRTSFSQLCLGPLALSLTLCVTGAWEMSSCRGAADVWPTS